MFGLAWFFGVDDVLMIFLFWVGRKAGYDYGESIYCWHFIAWDSGNRQHLNTVGWFGGIQVSFINE